MEGGQFRSKFTHNVHELVAQVHKLPDVRSIFNTHRKEKEEFKSQLQLKIISEPLRAEVVHNIVREAFEFSAQNKDAEPLFWTIRKLLLTVDDERTRSVLGGVEDAAKEWKGTIGNQKFPWSSRSLAFHIPAATLLSVLSFKLWEYDVKLVDTQAASEASLAIAGLVTGATWLVTLELANFAYANAQRNGFITPMRELPILLSEGKKGVEEYRHRHERRVMDSIELLLPPKRQSEVHSSNLKK